MTSLRDTAIAAIDIPRQFLGKIKNYLVRGRKINRFFKSDLAVVEHFDLPEKKVPLHILTVTYNNEMLTAQQVRLMRKNVKDEFVFIVADNTPDPLKRELIKKECKKACIGYISLPKNPYKTSSSSHGICLNWLVKNYISKYKPEYFGFIDHDLFPVTQHSLISHLNRQPIYGHWQGKKNYWYLWAGMCFYNRELIKDYKLNFMPASVRGKYADTGGSNWRTLYSKLDKSKIEFPSHSYIDLREGNVPQSDKMELIGEWLHSFNGSYWMKVEAKENVLFHYLNNL